MQVFFIEQNKTSGLFQKYIKPLEIKEDKIFINKKLNKIQDKKKIIQKIKAMLNQNNSNKIILDKSLKNDKEFINLLYSSDINIFEGTTLKRKCINKIIEKICEENKLKLEETTLAVTLNNVDTWELNLIKNYVAKFKHVSIITNKIQYFKRLQERLFEEDGIIITITNNKRKALLKANIIINIDFPEEILNKYRIGDNSIIINLEESIKIKKKRFCGKIINDFEIMLKDKSKIKEDLTCEKYKNFDIKDIAECYLINNPEELSNIKIKL